MKSQISSSLFGFVLIFGLISCSKDPTPDTWSLGKVVIQSPFPYGATIAAQALPTERPVPLKSEIVFVDSSAMDAVSFQIATRCLSEGKSYTRKISISPAPRLRIDHLLPLELYRSPGFKRVELASCHLELVARNRLGSTHQFHLSDLRFELPNNHPEERHPLFEHIIDSFRMPNTEIIDANELVVSPRRQAISRAPGQTADQNTEKGEAQKMTAFSNQNIRYSLICENFENHRVLNANEAKESLAQDLFLGPLMTPSGEAISGVIEPRHLTPTQTCSLTAVTASNPLPDLDYIPSLKIKFPAPEVEFVVEPTLSTSTTSSFPTHTVFTIKISNPRKAPVRLRLKNPPRAVSLKIHIVTLQLHYYGFWFRENMEVLMNGIRAEANSEGNFDFIIPSQSSSNVAFRLKDARRCLIDAVPHDLGPNLSPTRAAYVMGFGYKLDKPIEFEIFDSLDAQSLAGSLPRQLGLTLPIEGMIKRQEWIDLENGSLKGLQLHPFDLPEGYDCQK